MKYCFLLFIALSGLFSCHSRHHNWNGEEARARMDSLKNDLLKTDIAFSELSKSKGRNSAFIEYTRENATMLRPYGMPVSGKDSILSFMRSHADSSYALTWLPVYADVAHSGELGYTYGTYSLEIKDGGREEGTYCTIWKKDKEHKWKFVLDVGNEGLKPAEKE